MKKNKEPDWTDPVVYLTDKQLKDMCYRWAIKHLGMSWKRAVKLYKSGELHGTQAEAIIGSYLYLLGQSKS